MSRNVATLADPPASDAERASRRAAMRLWSVEELRAFLAQDYQDGDLVLAREDGAPIHPEQLTRTFRRHVAAAGLGPIRLHDLRHTRATLLMAWGAHPKVVQERLPPPLGALHAGRLLARDACPPGAGGGGLRRAARARSFAIR